jgi:hypothetical protein
LRNVSCLFPSIHLLAGFYDTAEEVHKAEDGEVAKQAAKAECPFGTTLYLMYKCSVAEVRSHQIFGYHVHLALHYI